MSLRNESGVSPDKTDGPNEIFMNDMSDSIDLTSNNSKAFEKNDLNTNISCKAKQSNFSPKKRFKPNHVEWFNYDSMSDIEMVEFKDFFNEDHSIKTPSNYIKLRNTLYDLYHSSPSRYLSLTTCRHYVPFETSISVRVFSFLEQWKLINYMCERQPASTSSTFASGDQTEINPLIKFCDNLKKDHDLIPNLSNQIPSSVFGLLKTMLDNSKDDLNVLQWSSEEVCKLLEGVKLYGEQWNLIAQHVNTSKSDQDCVLKYLALAENDIFSEVSSNEIGNSVNRSMDDFCFLDDSNHPLSVLICALASCVHPKILKSACKAALETHHQLMSSIIDVNSNEAPSGKEIPKTDPQLNDDSRNSVPLVVKGVSSAIAAVSVIANERSEQLTKKVRHALFELVTKQNGKIEEKLFNLNEIEQAFIVERDRLKILKQLLVQERTRFDSEIRGFNCDLAIFRSAVAKSNINLPEHPPFESKVDKVFPMGGDNTPTVPSSGVGGTPVENLSTGTGIPQNVTTTHYPTSDPKVNVNNNFVNNPSVNASPNKIIQNVSGNDPPRILSYQVPLNEAIQSNYGQVGELVHAPSNSQLSQFGNSRNMNLPSMPDRNHVGGAPSASHNQNTSSIPLHNLTGSKFTPSNTNENPQFMVPPYVQPQHHTQINPNLLNRPNIRPPVNSNISNVTLQIDPNSDMLSVMNRDNIQPQQQSNPVYFNVPTSNVPPSIRGLPSNQNPAYPIDPLKEQFYLQQQFSMIMNQCNNDTVNTGGGGGGNINNATNSNIMCNTNVQQPHGGQITNVSFSPMNPMAPVSSNPPQPMHYANMAPNNNSNAGMRMVRPSRQQLATKNDFMIPSSFNSNLVLGSDVSGTNQYHYQQFMPQQNIEISPSQTNNFPQTNVQMMKSGMQPSNININPNAIMNNFNQQQNQQRFT